MWYWLWQTWDSSCESYLSATRKFIGSHPHPKICRVCLTETVTRKCLALEDKLAKSKMSDMLPYRYKEFANLVPSMDASWNKQLAYGWQNMIALVPDPESQEWKDLRLTEEFEERGCNPTNSKKHCPQIRRFLEHHLIDASLLKEGKNEEN